MVSLQRRHAIEALAVLAVLVCTLSALAQAPTEALLVMRFDWVREGPTNACGKNCREWISAVGKITEETPQHFVDFAKGRDLQGSTVVLDSVGGNVSAGIWLGREFRRLRAMELRSATGTAALRLSTDTRAKPHKPHYVKSSAFVSFAAIGTNP